MNSELVLSPEKKEILLPTNPTFFVCLGTSGAGLSTAIRDVTQTGLVRNPPTQFTTRPLRANEHHGEQYYPVTDDVLAKIPKQIALEASMYGNRYGFFQPAVNQIRRILRTENIIIDSVNPKTDWQQVLPDQSLVSIFFAPQTPDISIQRVIRRAQDSGTPITQAEIDTRRTDSSISVAQIRDFDYWIDTSDFTTILPDLASIIKFHSFGSEDMPTAIKIPDYPTQIGELIKSYRR